MLERVYSTDHVATGSCWGLSTPNKGLNLLKQIWKHKNTIAFPTDPFSVLSFFQPVSEIALSRYRRGFQKKMNGGARQ